MAQEQGQETRISFKHEIDFSLPFPSPLLAQHAASVIKVDKELRPMDVVKSFQVIDLDDSDRGHGATLDRKNGTKNGALLNINLKATTLRHLRISTNALLEDLSLIIRTMDSFLPEHIRKQISTDAFKTDSSEKSLEGLRELRIRDGQTEEQEEEEFEQGKIGVAG